MDELRLLRQWAEYMVAQGRSEGTIRRYRYAILRFLSETPRDTLSEITEQDVVVFLASLGKRAHSRQLYLNALRSFFEWAQQRGHITENPARHLHPKAPTDPPPDAYTEEEIVLLVQAAGQKSEKRALAITACYALGLRRSELCGIKAEDIDWHGRKVFIREAKGDKPRWVEMNELAREALRLMIDIQNQSIRTIETNLPVVGYAPQWFTMIVRQAAAAAGLPPNRRRAHMLRASAATHMLGKGAPISVVSRILGHSNIRTTSRYLAVSDVDRRQAVDMLVLPASIRGIEPRLQRFGSLPQVG